MTENVQVPEKIKHLITDDPNILYDLFLAGEAQFKESFLKEGRKYPELAEAEEEFGHDAMAHILVWTQRDLNILRDNGLDLVRLVENKDA